MIELNKYRPKPDDVTTVLVEGTFCGAENHKPQLNQLYDDITLLSNERSHYRKALLDLRSMLKNQEMDEHMIKVITQTIQKALEFDPYDGS